MKAYVTHLSRLEGLPQGYREDLVDAGNVVGDRIVHKASDLKRVLLKWAPDRLKELGLAAYGVASSFQVRKGEVPLERWPKWIKALADERRDGEAGVGDTVERLAGQLGLDFKAAYRKVTGRPCGCDGRRQALNDAYPYRELRK